MSTVLVTGGAGFIGSNLCKTLLVEPNLKVVVIDNFTLGSPENLQSILDNPRFKLFEGDVNDTSIMEKIFREYEFDRVYHLAANSDISISHNNPSVDFTNTFHTTWSVLESMRKFKVNELVFASTSAIFGEVNENINETFGPLIPISHYGAGKLASEAFISSFCYNYDINTLIVRFPNVVGGNSTHGIIYDFLRKIAANKQELIVLGNGAQEKSYLHVSDLIRAILHCWDNKKSNYDIFNIGGLDTINVKRIAEIVLDETNSSHLIKFTGGDRGWKGDVPKFNYDITKLKSTGWFPFLNSEEAIKKTVQELNK